MLSRPPSLCRRPPSPRRPCLAVAVLCAATVIALACGCSVPQRGSTHPNAVRARNQAPDGALVYQSYCVECHEPRVTGNLEHPALAGDDTLTRFSTAAELHRYVESHMPTLGKSELAADDYWDVVSFLVLCNGGTLPAGGANASNADGIAIHAP